MYDVQKENEPGGAQTVMISVWYLIPAVMLGVFVGIAMIAIYSANRSDDKRKKDDE